MNSSLLPQPDDRSGLEPDRPALVRQAQTRLLLANQPMSALISLVCALLIAGLFYQRDHTDGLAVWLVLMGLLQLWRWHTARCFAQQDARHGSAAERWLARALAGAALAGALWGILGGLLFPAGDLVAQTFMVVVMAGLSGGAVTTLNVSPAAMLLFTLPALLPLAARFATIGTPSGWMLAFLVCLFILGLVLSGRRTGRTVTENETLRQVLLHRERLLEKANLELHAVFDNARQFLAVLGLDGRVLRGNRTAVELCGCCDATVLAGLPLVDAPCWLPESRQRLVAMISQAAGGQKAHGELAMRCSDGRQGMLEIDLVRLDDPSGEVPRLVMAATDLTERVEADRRLRGSEEKFRRLVERSLVGVYIVDGGRFSYVNPVFASIFGYQSDEIVNELELADLVHEDDLPTVLENVRKRIAGEIESVRYTFKGRHREGHPIEVEVMGTRTDIDGHAVIIGTMVDITEQRRAQRRIERLANVDDLTELANRRQLSERAAQLIVEHRQSALPMTFMFLDLDRFKNVNDAFGHGTGDRLLVQVGRRLLRCLRDDDLVARMGGDEFGFLLPNSEREAAAIVARRVSEVLSRPFELDGAQARIGCSIGIASLSETEYDFETLAKCADIAMYRAKRTGESFAFYESGEASLVTTRFALENELRVALADEIIELHYQPRCDLVTGRYDSVEALARWNHPERGPIPPGVFIPIAEESGQIRELGQYVLRHACRDLVAWRRAGLAVRMAINLSVHELKDPNLVARVTALLDEFGLDGNLLEIEVTESAAMTDPASNVATLNRLKALGIGLAIDDFGTGYSSLSYLKQLPADYLKIDRSFVDGVSEHGPASTDADIVRSIVALANSLQLEVIAEGVERADQEAFLVGLGCRFVQGYYYCRPQPEAAMRELLLAQSHTGAPHLKLVKPHD